MPGRNIPLVTGEIYHIFNKGVASQPIFLDKKDYIRAIHAFLYYQNESLPLKYSGFLALSISDQRKVLTELKKKNRFLVNNIAYCLMPTHFHFLVRQEKDHGISEFISHFSNSYSRYFNTKNERIGPLFQGRFKAVRVENDEQVLHLSRYIHLNPFSSYVVKSINDLVEYPFSSFREYLTLDKNNFCDKNLIMSNFDNSNSYKKFILDYAEHQRLLKNIEHLMLEK